MTLTLFVCLSYLRNTLFPVQADHGLNVSAIGDDSLFVPVVSSPLSSRALVPSLVPSLLVI